MKNMMNQMKKLAAACLITLGVIAAAGGTSFAATTTTTCANCNGSGKAVCTWCDGKGYKTVLDYSYTCITCEGTGHAKCLHCLGKGTKTTGTPDTNTAAAVPMAPGFATVPGTVVLPTSPVMAPTAGMGGMCTQMNCPVCRGTGRKVCTSCSGNGFRETRKSGINLGYGSSYYWTKSGCAACGGSGQSMCTHCGGDGML